MRDRYTVGASEKVKIQLLHAGLVPIHSNCNTVLYHTHLCISGWDQLTIITLFCLLSLSQPRQPKRNTFAQCFVHQITKQPCQRDATVPITFFEQQIL